MPDLFSLLPSLAQVSHPLLEGQRIVVVGVSAVLYDEHAFIFEVTRPRHWGRTENGRPIVGVGGIGGRIEPGEGAVACLRREVREEISTDFRLEPRQATVSVCDGEMEGWLDERNEMGQPVPYMINLLPPQIHRFEQQDHVAIVTFRGHVQGQTRLADVFGLLSVEHSALLAFFERDEWTIEDASALRSVGLRLTQDLPADAVVRPTLTARAFRVLAMTWATTESLTGMPLHQVSGSSNASPSSTAWPSLSS